MSHAQLCIMIDCLMLLCSFLLSFATLPSFAAPTGPFQTANLSSQNVFGLPPNGLLKNNIHIGALPDWSRENPSHLSRALGKGISIIGDYISESLHHREPCEESAHIDTRRIAERILVFPIRLPFERCRQRRPRRRQGCVRSGYLVQRHMCPVDSNYDTRPRFEVEIVGIGWRHNMAPLPV